MFNAIRSIKRAKVFVFFIVFQLALGLALVNNVLIQNFGAMSKKEAFIKMFNPNNTYVVRILEGIQEDDTTPSPDISYSYKIRDEIYNLKKENLVNDVYSCFNNPIMLEHIEEIAPDKYKKLYGKLKGQFLCNLVIDENILKRYSFKVSEGRELNKDDFNIDYKKETVPILLGQDYKGRVSIGDTFSEKKVIEYDEEGNSIKDDVKFEVVGFLETDSTFTFLSKRTFFQEVTFSNSIVIIPEVESVVFYSSAISSHDVGLFVQGNENSKKADIEDYANKIIKSVDPDNLYSYKAQVTYLKEDIEKVDTNLQNDINVKILLGTVLTILSLVGITTTILGNIKNRRKEFGTRLSAGATIKRLCQELVYEVLIMTTMAIVISNIYLKSTMEVYKLSLTLLLSDIGIILIFTLIISILPVLVLRKYNVIDLLREEQ